MRFHEKRRQQFLGEHYYNTELARLPESIAYFKQNPVGSGATDLHRHMLARLTSAEQQADLLLLRYTAGEPIETLRAELEDAIAAYERYGEYLWDYTGDRNEVVFAFANLTEYCQLMQMIGLCFLLHRRDLLPRLAALQDGEGGTSNGGADTLYEEFMAFGLGPETRFETDHLSQVRPFESLFFGLTETTPEKSLKELNLFLKNWYKDLAGTTWHDAHRTEGGKDPAGYYGYWSFEAGAAVLLLGIEDDSSLHKYLYYPKDLVAWARANAALSDTGSDAKTPRLRCPAGETCPKAGYWLTPAKADSRRHFKAGEIMPRFDSDYGETIWQWDERQ